MSGEPDRHQSEERSQQKKIKRKKYFVSNKKQVCRNQGPSAFIRSKLELQYNPVLNDIPKSFSPYSQAERSLHKQKQRIRLDEENMVINKARQQVKNGNKIVIDWSTKTNFRSTRFPSITVASPKIVSKRIKSETFEKQKIRPNFSLMERSINNTQIIQKSMYLKDLISETVTPRQVIKLPKSKFNKKLNMKKTIKNDDQNLNDVEIQTIHGDISFEEKMKMRQKLFFKQNSERINQAMNVEEQIIQPLGTSKTKKLQLQQMQKRILDRSKLTLLKSDLIKKFKEIRDSYLQELVDKELDNNDDYASNISHSQK